MRLYNRIRQYISKLCVTVTACVMAMLLVPVSTQALPVEHYAASSVLSSGRWYKISIKESGMYQISYSQLKSWGFQDPSRVRIYGYGGALLPETYSTNDIDDLPQIPIVHNNNRIIFYGQGTVKWWFDNKSNTMKQRQNTYANEGCYFITESDVEQVTTTPAYIYETPSEELVEIYDGYSLHEQELASMSRTGQMFFGEDFRYTQTRNFSFDIPGIETEYPMRVDIAFGAKITGGTGSLRVYHNGTKISDGSNWSIAANTDATYEFMKYISPSATCTPRGGKEEFSITYQSGGMTVNARLDYIRLSYKRRLQLYDGAVQFRVHDYTLRQSYAIGGMNEQCIVWDITTQHAPQHVDFTISDNRAIFNAMQTGREYIAFDPSATFPTPSGLGAIGNQDLHALETPDMVILAPGQFLTQAQQVAALHESIDSMVVHVIDHELVFNEFSSGTADGVAYRRLMKMFYDRSKADPSGRQVKYLLLFGRGFYDNRRVITEIKNCGFPTLLTYQSPRSENETYSYTSDDFFTYLEDDATSRNSTNIMSIGVGRFPIKSDAEANVIVEKLYNYVNKPNYGSWRNQAIIIADDGNSGTHMRQAESAISFWLDDKPDLFVNKIYIDAYTEQNTSTGRTFPEAKKRMMQLLKDGQLVLDYVGHANSVGWTAEDMLNINDIKTLYLKNLPFMFTATCDFSRYDSEEVSGGEYFFLNEFGGAISLFSSTRVAWINENGRLNNAIGDYLFERDENDEYLRLGDIVRKAKNNLTEQYLVSPSKYAPDSNKLVYALLGDPAMRLGYPSYHIEATSINGEEATTMVTLQSRSEVSIEGRILSPSGEAAGDFNGEVYVTLYDAEQTTTSHGYDDSVPVEFQERTNKLFSGRAIVTDGKFGLTFRMPKETSFSNKPGLLDFYAYSYDGIEASGASTAVKIGGVAEAATNDTIGPDITYCYLNTSNFSDGDVVNESPVLFAAISDSSGINLSTAGIGHNMTATIDGTTSYSDLNSYYTPDTTGYSGIICYPLDNLSEGEHTLTLRVWDNECNSSSTTLHFVVENGLTPEIYKIYADQNPARTTTNFFLEHDRPDGTVTVTLTIYNIKGMPVWQTQKTGISDMFKTFPITWNLTTSSGATVPGGVYIYRATISTDNTHIATRSQKLLVAPQR